MQGLHLTADLHQCACSDALLTDATLLATRCRERVEAAGLTVVNEVWHAFPGVLGQGGVTGVLLLAESHLAIHTWPEQRAVTLDVYVCNFGADNSARAHHLMAALSAEFAAGQTQQHSLQRGLAPSPGN
ncbi:adenosylmethionine decarboxylase [Uliginosibacterium sp. TH139]|uniref:adenosylmethionine decarboxylase n=1 Tax=Uliginosibacterium sp. TH139 TaxID=2067453 RepID=UPI000C79EECF|nr:adenosylmethionine decarboxylase [Uliginosibacterium sp. TH139]PLK48531.1 adenosylmethionine decarboxylase [Uliginosibacterium sp. TH139]